MDYKDTWAMLSSIADVSEGKVTPLVRVPSNSLWHIKRALDCGGQGVIVPMINTKQEAIETVKHGLYPPLGIRGYGGFDPQIGYNTTRPEYVKNANKQILIIPQIETGKAINNLEEILSVPGISGLFLGPGDLHFDLGLTPATWSDHPLFQDAIKHFKNQCIKHKVPFGTLSANPAEAASRSKEGFQIIAMGSDNMVITRAVLNEVETYKKLVSSK